MTEIDRRRILIAPVRAARLSTFYTGGAAMVTFGDMFTYTLVLIALATLIATIMKGKK